MTISSLFLSYEKFSAKRRSLVQISHSPSSSRWGQKITYKKKKKILNDILYVKLLINKACLELFSENSFPFFFFLKKKRTENSKKKMHSKNILKTVSNELFLKTAWFQRTSK